MLDEEFFSIKLCSKCNFIIRDLRLRNCTLTYMVNNLRSQSVFILCAVMGACFIQLFCLVQSHSVLLPRSKVALRKFKFSLGHNSLLG